MDMFRQGDVLIMRDDSVDLRKGQKLEREQGRVVLAHGEATGHAHAIADQTADLYAINEQVYLRVKGEGAALRHEEHDTINLPPGKYIVRRQREYTPEDIRYVAD